VGILDLLIVAAAVLAAVSGYRRGATLQLAEYAGFAAGLVAGALVAPAVASLASDPAWRAVLALLTCWPGRPGRQHRNADRPRVGPGAGALARMDSVLGSISVAVILLAV
jgi:hypothetical protein